MYCVRCKKQTDTTNEQFTTSKNNRRMKRGKCAVCGTTKTQFVKSTKGGSILNKMINNLPVEMHLLGHNFTGPGTKLNKRLNADLTPKEWSKPINPFPNKPWFLRVCSTSLLKTLWKKKKLLETSNFFFSHSVFYPFRDFSAIFMKFKIVICKVFQFGRV